MLYERAVVTGASSGIGAEIALGLCNKGIEVLAVARSEQKLRAVKSSLDISKRALFVAVLADVSTEQGLQKVIRTAHKRGRVNLVINNAAVGISKRFADYSSQEIDLVINTNLRAPIRLAQAFINSRKSRKTPLDFVFVSSLAGKIGFPELSTYSSSKFGIEGLVESLKNEYIDQPVRFTILRPGVTDTNFFNTAGMQCFHKSVQGTRSLHSPQKVATEFIKKLPSMPSVIVVGNDKYFLKLLPFIPFRMRFKFLDIVNKI